MGCQSRLEEIYILPLGFVVESLQPQSEDIKEIKGKGRVIKIRQEYLPLIPSIRVFQHRTTPH